MKRLFGAWKEISARIVSAERILFMSDFDGTLSRIVSLPGQARLDAGVRQLLGSAAERPVFRVAVVSGRELAGIKKMVGLPGLYYVGNHGLELSGPGWHYLHPKAKGLRPAVRKLKKRLEAGLGQIPGVIIENKGLGIGIHYRRLSGNELKRTRDAFSKIRKEILPEKTVKVSAGKKVWEIKPDIDWDKGKAVLFLWRKLSRKGGQFLPVYLGDDVTDEDAFAALRNRGITVRVGRNRRSQADYYLDSIKEVREFLRRLVAIRT